MRLAILRPQPVDIKQASPVWEAGTLAARVFDGAGRRLSNAAVVVEEIRCGVVSPLPTGFRFTSCNGTSDSCMAALRCFMPSV